MCVLDYKAKPRNILLFSAVKFIPVEFRKCGLGSSPPHERDVVLPVAKTLFWLKFHHLEVVAEGTPPPWWKGKVTRSFATEVPKQELA